MTRSYESNGPDVKIRGSAQQIAEKYAALARDAHGSGDRVMAENYLQHAEHYNRIIAAAQAQLQIQVQRDYRDEYDDDEDVELAPVQERRASSAPAVAHDGDGPQPVISGVPAEVALTEPAAAPANGPVAEESGAEQAEANAEQPKITRRVRRPRKTAKTAEAEQGAEEGESKAASDSDTQLAAAGS